MKSTNNFSYLTFFQNLTNLSPQKLFLLQSIFIPIIFCNNSALANSQTNKIQNVQPINTISTKNIKQPNIEELFDKAFYMHTRPYFKNNDVLAKIRELMNISLGGNKKIDFIGLGYREKTIEWDGHALENTYKKVLDMHTEGYQQQGSDISNGFTDSLLSTN